MEKVYIVNGERVDKNAYNRAKYERIIFSVPKGRREAIKARAQEKGMSLSAYIVGLIERDMGN